MSRVVHFQMTAKEPQKVIDFYSAVLDWKFEKRDNPGSDYWMVTTGDEQTPGIHGGLASGDPVGAVVNTVGVADLNATIEKVEEHGGKVVEPRMARPGMGWFASVEDPAGNQFGLLQADPAEATRLVPAQSEQPSAPVVPGDRVAPQSGRSTKAAVARGVHRPPRQSLPRSSRSGSRSPRPRTKTNRRARA